MANYIVEWTFTPEQQQQRWIANAIPLGSSERHEVSGADLTPEFRELELRALVARSNYYGAGSLVLTWDDSLVKSRSVDSAAQYGSGVHPRPLDVRAAAPSPQPTQDDAIAAAIAALQAAAEYAPQFQAQYAAAQAAEAEAEEVARAEREARDAREREASRARAAAKEQFERDWLAALCKWAEHQGSEDLRYAIAESYPGVRARALRELRQSLPEIEGAELTELLDDDGERTIPNAQSRELHAKISAAMTAVSLPEGCTVEVSRLRHSKRWIQGDPDGDRELDSDGEYKAQGTGVDIHLVFQGESIPLATYSWNWD